MEVAAGAAGADEGQGGGESEGAIRASNQRSQQDSAGADDGQVLAGAGVEGAPDGGAGGDGEGGKNAVDLAAVLKAAGVGAAEIRAMLESLTDEEQAELLQDKLTSAEERGRQRAQEAKDAQTTRQSAYTVVASAGAQAHGTIRQILAQEFGEQDEEGNRRLTSRGQKLWSAIEAYKTGAIGHAGTEQENDLKVVREKFADVLVDLTPEQKKRLEAAEYQQAMRGGYAEVIATIEIALEKLRSEQKPGKNGKTDAASAELAERVKSIVEQIGKLPPRTPTGRGPNTASERESIRKEIAALDVKDPKYDDKWKDLKAREAALAKG